MPLSEIWIAFLTISRKETTRFLRIWSQTLLPSAVTQTLYFLIFGAFIGSQVAEINGVSYMAFIVPGLIMQAVITNSFSNVVSSFFGSKFQKNIEELMVSPTPNWVIILGYVNGGVLRGIVVGVIVFLISVFFTQPQINNILIIALFVVLTAIAFSLAGFLNGLFAQKFDHVSIFPTFVLTPLTYLGGVFYSIDNLPEFWKIISQLNPILYMVNGFRYGFYGISDVNIGASLGILIIFIFVMSALSLYFMNKGHGLKN
jgi:ABC-2 type transport system permease protein